jgi:hypothetical protein
MAFPLLLLLIHVMFYAENYCITFKRNGSTKIFCF